MKALLPTGSPFFFPPSTFYLRLCPVNSSCFLVKRLTYLESNLASHHLWSSGVSVCFDGILDCLAGI